MIHRPALIVEVPGCLNCFSAKLEPVPERRDRSGDPKLDALICPGCKTVMVQDWQSGQYIWIKLDEGADGYLAALDVKDKPVVVPPEAEAALERDIASRL